MEFRELKTFQVVASLLSFNKAAKVLHYAQSTVSSQIQSLENSLHEPLFVRSGSKISLTPSGVNLLKYTQRLISLENEILSSFHNAEEATGRLIVKTPHSVAAYYLPEIIHKFQKKFPNINFDFDGCIGFNFNDIFNSGVIDVAFLFSDCITEKALYVEELADAELCFVVNARVRSFAKDQLSIGDFQENTLILSKSDCSYRMIFEKMLLEAGISPKKTIELNSPEAIKRCLEIGHAGVALLPKIAVERELEEGTLKCLKWKGRKFNAKLYMIWKKDKYQTDAAREFIKTVRAGFKR
jgi:DNA-binding transcriptional LysR family regulator